MKQRRTLPLPTAVIAAVAALLLLACIVWMGLARRGRSAELTSVRASRQVMGTLASIEAVGPSGQEDHLRRAVDQAYATIDRVESLMSSYRPDSLVSRINRQAAEQPVELDEWTWEVVRQSRRYWELSGGAFDPTCGPLIELWKQAGKKGRLPSEEELAAAKARTGFDKVALDETARTIRFAQPGMRIDLGAIAKGYGIDLAIETMRSTGCTGGLVDVGGDIRTFGRPGDDEHWNLEVQNPFEPGALAYLAINDAAVCTSGNYHRFVTIQGHRYSHIIDPRTGDPAEMTPSVTIIGEETTGTDALATAVSVLGAKEGIDLINRVPGYEALVVTGTPAAPRMVQSAGLAAHIAK